MSDVLLWFIFCAIVFVGMEIWLLRKAIERANK